MCVCSVGTVWLEAALPQTKMTVRASLVEVRLCVQHPVMFVVKPYLSAPEMSRKCFHLTCCWDALWLLCIKVHLQGHVREGTKSWNVRNLCREPAWAGSKIPCSRKRRWGEKGCRSAAKVLTGRPLNAHPFCWVPHEGDLSSEHSAHWNKGAVFTSHISAEIQPECFVFFVFF